jgi:uncharacterized protein (DUF305 family)
MKTFMIWIVALLGLLTFVLPSVSAGEPTEGRAGRAEMRFLEGMSDHHQMALDMANDCINKAESADVQALCQAVIDAQTPEIEQMQAWLLDWYNIDYAPVPMMDMAEEDSMEGMDHGGHGDMAMDNQPATDPAMMMGMMAGLNRLEGADYEMAWLESMIDHHDDAIHMAERILERAQHPELIQLAENIISAQSAEIQTMETMIAAMGGE